MKKKSTQELEHILSHARPEELKDYLRDNSASMEEAERPFGNYMRELLKAKDLRQQDVFLAADIPERYGYKLLSQEKHTRQRDVILRLCFASHCTLDETQQALKLYETAPLYVRFPRDAALMLAFNSGLYEIHQVQEYLEEHGFDPLRPCGTEE